MKKIIGFTVTLFTVATLFAAARPSLDGRALVADAGTMPKGLFARTIGYLPGDSVVVTNPATGSTVDVLILGAIDPTEGVAILLSPEAADQLHIKKDSNVQVKITKRAGSLDEAVSGTAMLAEGEDEYVAYADEGEDGFEEIIGNDIAPITQEYTPTPTTVVEDTYDATPSYTAPDDSAVATQPVIIEYTPYPPEYTATESSGVVEEGDDTSVEFTLAEELPSYGDETTSTLVDSYEPEPYTEPTRIEFVDVSGEDDTNNEVDDYLNELADSLRPSDDLITEFIPDDASNEPESLAEELPTTDIVPDVAPAFENVALSENYALEDISATAIPSEPTPSANVAPSLVVTVPEATESTVSTEPQTPPVEAAADEYQSIVLVPAGENPPASEPQLSTDALLAPAASIVAPTTSVAPAATNKEQYIVPSLKALESGSYYVQIASLGNQENIDAILDTYAEKYPIALVPLASGASYQVLVGPLTVDEYPVIREKFKSFGFKDAFLRKIR